MDERAFLLGLFQAAVRAADPALCVPPHLPPQPKGRTIVLGAGKAAAAMARAVETHWNGPLEGLVVTRYGHAVPCSQIEVVEAAHPVPDRAGEDAARRILALAGEAGEDDLVLCLISGGGSALLSAPRDGVSLAEKQAVNRALLRSGATISEMNTVRKRLSAIKGGRLAAAAAPAKVLALVISDVPGDDPAVIASGPTVPDPTTNEDALRILDRYGIDVPGRLRALIADPAGETPKAALAAFGETRTIVVATPQMALEVAAAAAREAGVTPLILGDAIEGEAREVGIVLAGVARQVAVHGQPARPPVVLLSGGETTVTVKGRGRGGRNTEFLLSFALASGGRRSIHALACDTDGIDGSEDNAGAWCGPQTLPRARLAGRDAAAHLADNDGYGFFSALGDLVVTGPTLTNVNDFRAILVTGEADAS